MAFPNCKIGIVFKRFRVRCGCCHHSHLGCHHPASFDKGSKMNCGLFSELHNFKMWGIFLWKLYSRFPLCRQYPEFPLRQPRGLDTLFHPMQKCLLVCPPIVPSGTPRLDSVPKKAETILFPNDPRFCTAAECTRQDPAIFILCFT